MKLERIKQLRTKYKKRVKRVELILADNPKINHAGFIEQLEDDKDILKTLEADVVRVSRQRIYNKTYIPKNKRVKKDKHRALLTFWRKK